MIRRWTEIRSTRLSAVGALLLACALAPAASAQRDSTAGETTKKTTAAKKPSSSTTKKHRSTATTGAKKSGSGVHSASGKRSRGKGRARGQQKIDSERAQSIQEALIREHYLNGQATGTWNQASEEAMRRYQADNGWQSKTVPDSRALIKLGLGPSNDHLLNPESAMTTMPGKPKAEPTSTTSHTSPPAADPIAPVSSSQVDSAKPQ